MIDRLGKLLKGEESSNKVRPMPTRYVYQPQPPLGFVRRSDPNFYFLTRR